MKTQQLQRRPLKLNGTRPKKGLEKKKKRAGRLPGPEQRLFGNTSKGWKQEERLRSSQPASLAQLHRVRQDGGEAAGRRPAEHYDAAS